MKAILINALVFQAGWLCCVLAGAHRLPWLGTLTALLIVAWHVGRAAVPRRELTLVLSAGAIGALWDSLLVYAGLLQYPSGILVPGSAPHWIVAMWLLFATTLNVSLRWLRGRPVLAAALGAAGGPGAYLAGWKLGGVQIPELAPALLALGAGWALFMPLLIRLGMRFDGIRPQPAPAGFTRCNARV
jgi:hypothetical protein